MTPAKSIGAGLLFVLGPLVVIFFGGFVYIFLAPPPKGGGVWGWDPISFVRFSPYAWAAILVSFATGFIWEYRRLPH